ncbi:3-phosphoshikimate 1-carboxyvinyltransferase [Demequina sp. NBRC 110057]|uniref:3-phosphoshikimate 1-carboxyvinyltransferase n=1 Tax=Demequina sp. NBRC 110057 TaxID=1570346 RepID=UPI0009FC06A4|nr:3-phosphoshikimate 1-carboxyvinyltransferase [Demequina sp. NBRC 110057]
MTAADLPRGTGPGQVWPAPAARGPLNATVEVPGSKSLTNRFLVLAAMADAPVTIRGGLVSRDSELMIAALTALGQDVDASGDAWTVTPGPVRGNASVFCGLAGTVMRFVPPMVLLADGPVAFDGDPEARVRPMGPLLDALRALGATVEDEGRGTLPFTVTPPAAIPAEVDVDSSASSQFVTGLLLVAARLPQGLTVRHTGATLPSLPHIDMTCETLRAAGVRVDQPDERTWIVHPGALELGAVRVEPDLSNAGPFIAAPLVAGGTVRIPGWPSQTTQPGALFPQILERMGATCTLDGDVLSVSAPGLGAGGAAGIAGIDADLSPAGEITPTIAALCALASSRSVLSGIGHLRGHETDRLAAIAAEVERIGGRCVADDDSLTFDGLPASGLAPAAMESYHDHRMATFAAIIGLAVAGTEVVHVGTTAKTMPDFPAMWTEMLGA